MAYIPPLNGGRINASITGNTTGTAALVSTGTMYLSGGSNITLSQSNNTLGILGPTFINSNGLTFGTNGSQVTASVVAPAGSNTIGLSGGNSSGNVGFLSGSNFQYAFAGGNNITLSQSITNNSATLTVVGPSFSNSNNVSLGISNNGVVTASASFSQTLQTSNVIQALSANGSSAATGTVVFSNSNNVSFGMNGSVMTASAGAAAAGVALSAPGSSYSSGTVNFSASAGAITISGSSNSINFVGPSFSNSNNVSLGISNNGVVTASASFSQTLQTANNIQALSASGSSAATGTVTFSNSNNVSFGMNGNVITASAGGGGVAISATNSSYSSGTLVMSAASGALTISGTSNSLNFGVPATSMLSATGGLTLSTAGSTVNIGAPAMTLLTATGGVSLSTSGSTVTISAPATSHMIGTNGLFLSSYSNSISFGVNVSHGFEDIAYRPLMTNLTNITAINGIPIFQPFYNFGILTINRMDIELMRATTGSNNFSIFAGIYSYINYGQISLMSSISNSYSNTATASNGGNGSIIRLGITGFNRTLAPGEYILGMMFTAATSRTASMNYSLRGGSIPPTMYMIGGADNYQTTATYNGMPFFGRYTVSTAALPSSMSSGVLNANGTNATMLGLPWWVGLYFA